MSDSDDTDILLLIPSDYFSVELQQEKQQVQNTNNDYRHLLGSTMSNNNEDACAAASIAPTTAAYQFLPPSKRAELNQLNARLQRFQQQHDEQQIGDIFNAPSDISSISNHTVRTRPPRTTQQQGHFELVHSTPKCASPTKPTDVGLNRHNDAGVLLEIENYFGDERRLSACSLPAATTHLDNNLISLSEIWGQSNRHWTTAVAAPTHCASDQTASLKEEQLRRYHLEKTVATLQAQLLEYQQRLSVAIEVDRSKDAALQGAQADNARLRAEGQQCRDALQRAEAETRAADKTVAQLRDDLTQAQLTSADQRTQCEKLAAELAEREQCTIECRQRLETLELQLHTSRRSEDYANGELRQLKDKLAKLEYQSDKQNARDEESQRECATLRQQKETLHELQQKQRQRADTLENQRRAVEQRLQRAESDMAALQRKFDVQPRTLKAHYQQQLETVVAQKLRDFQAQLDKTEESLRSEARERERMLAERAVRQLELINEKGEQELELLQQRHDEEVELYRIQLASASKKIDELETKLRSYKSKRADMAEQLHAVMETQWHKALEILTSPAATSALNVAADSAVAESADISADNNETPCGKQSQHNTSGSHFETPKKANNKQRRLPSATSKENNLNTLSQQRTVDELAGHDAQPIDRLQAYIELLLSKSPSDFDKLEELLALSKRSNAKAASAAAAKRNQNHNGNKPPWKGP